MPFVFEMEPAMNIYQVINFYHFQSKLTEATVK